MIFTDTSSPLFLVMGFLQDRREPGLDDGGWVRAGGCARRRTGVGCMAPGSACTLTEYPCLTTFR